MRLLNEYIAKLARQRDALIDPDELRPSDLGPLEEQDDTY